MALDIKIPSRKEAIKDFRSNGGKIAVVFPIHYPRALLRAHGILPVETWGPPMADLSLGDAHLQSYTCSVVRHGLSYLLEYGLDVADMILVPHCCDTLQGLGSILRDFVPLKQPVYTFYIPRARREIDIEYFARELYALSERLSRTSGKTPDQATLKTAIEEEELAASNAKALFTVRRELPINNREFYSLIRSREYLPAETFNELTSQVLADKRCQPGEEIPLMLTGIVPEPAVEMFDALNGMKAIIVEDDCLCTGRRIYEQRHCHDPWNRMSETIVLGPPDAALGVSFEHRLKHVKKLVNSSGARGVVFCHVKFCEPEQFYIPAIKKSLKDSGIPSMIIESDLGDAPSGQSITRLETFMEMIS